MVDHNVGKIAKWLRMMGFDTSFFTGLNDTDMVNIALREDRILLTRDTGIMERRVVTNGQLKAILIKSDRLPQQTQQVIDDLQLRQDQIRPFTICMECNIKLVERTIEEVRDRVPPYVFATQTHFVECPSCHRIYWQGTHWQNMVSKISNLNIQKS